jgi:hypothetical protein
LPFGNNVCQPACLRVMLGFITRKSKEEA